MGSTTAQAKSVELDAEDAKDLAKWTASASISSLKDFLHNQAIEHLLSTAIEKALEAEAEGPVAIASILREYNSINLEEQGFMALKIGTQTMNLRVTEVSYCTQGEECGPGYSPGKQRYDGIHPYLYFQFVADRGPEGSEFGRHPVLEDSFIVPYSAEAWMETQFGG